MINVASLPQVEGMIALSLLSVCLHCDVAYNPARLKAASAAQFRRRPIAAFLLLDLLPRYDALYPLIRLQPPSFLTLPKMPLDNFSYHSSLERRTNDLVCLLVPATLAFSPPATH